MQRVSLDKPARQTFKAITAEARQQPRVVVNLPVQLQFEHNAPVNTVVYDVSPSSMQIRCDATTAALINPHSVDLSRHNVRTHVKLHLPLNAGALVFEADCSIVHQSVCEHEHISFGLRFDEFSRIGARILTSFIQSSREPQLSWVL